MKELLDMTEAHLTNVRQEIDRLSQQRDQISDELENLNSYLKEGVKVLDSYRTDMPEEASSVKDTP